MKCQITTLKIIIKKTHCFIKLYQFFIQDIESKHDLNVGKYVAIFDDKGKGFVDFNKWKHENITEKIQKEYSNSEHEQRISMLNDIMISLNLSNTYKVFCVINARLSVIMTPFKV